MNEKEHLAFENYILQAGSDLFKHHHNDEEKAEGRQIVTAHIQTASQFLQATEAESVEHCFTLATLCHAYKALALYDWNWETKVALDTLRQFIECLTILGCTYKLSSKSKSYIAEQRLWACERYRRALSEQSDLSPNLLSHQDLDDIVDQDFVKVVHAHSHLVKSDAVEDVLYHALFERRIGTKTNLDAAPIADWWRDGVDDRSIFLLRKIRLGQDFYSIEIWQWQFEVMLRSIAKSFDSQSFQILINRIAAKQCILSAHKSGKFKQPNMDAKVFWLRCWRTQYYKGYRVYAAAIVLQRKLVETIIAAPIPDKEKQKALSHLRPVTVFTKANMKTYEEHLKLTTDLEIYQHIISGCMLK